MVSVRSLPLFLLTTNVSKELYRHQNSPAVASILSFASSFCGRCALLHHFISKKIFRRSNKYLLRRYKRNMFRVVFR